MRMNLDRRRWVLKLGFGCFMMLLASPVVWCQDGKTQPVSPDAKPIAGKPDGAPITKLQADAIALAENYRGPVFEFAQSGNQIRPAAKQNRNSKLQLFADGKVIVGGRRGVQAIESRFSRAELDEFLNFVVNKNRFYELDSVDIEARMKGKKPLDVNDGNNSIFTIELKRGKHEVSIYTLWNAVRSFPGFEEVQRLGAIEKRCNTIISRINLGDQGEEILQIVNSKVKELTLGLEPFSLDEMRLATPLAKGGFQVSFERRLTNGNEAPGGTPRKMHAIYFKRDSKTDPKVSFYNLPKKN